MLSVVVHIDIATTVAVGGILLSICLYVDAVKHNRLCCSSNSMHFYSVYVLCLSHEEFTAQSNWSLRVRRCVYRSSDVLLLTLMCHRKLSSSASDENYDPAKSQYNPVKDAGWSESSKCVHCCLSLCMSVCLAICLSVHLSV